MPTFILNDQDAINTYNFRVRTDGIDTSRFLTNPVMLDSHNNTLQSVLGRWKNLNKSNSGQLLADTEFDTVKPSVAEIEGQVERGFVKGVSMGITFALEHMVRAADGVLELIKCVLLEASICAVPSNGSSLRLFSDDGKLISDKEVSLALSAIGDGKESFVGSPSGTVVRFKSKAELFAAPIEQQNAFYDNHYDDFVKLFSPQTQKTMNQSNTGKFSNILSFDDFEKLSVSEMLFFKNNHNLAYKQLFNDDAAADNSALLSVSQYKFQDIKSSDDFQKLSLGAMLHFRDNYSAQYKAVFA